jgi:hypothetical protein
MLTDLDEALERLHSTDFECGDGSVNQGPVVVVALERLGHPALIPAFSDVYRPRLRPLPGGSQIAEKARIRALGQRGRRGDWLVTFERELAEDGPETVISRRLPALLPGAFAAAGAGPMRTGMACLALAERNDPLRRRELAFGLALWASRYQVLPGDPGARPVAGRRLVDVLGRVQGMASGRRRVGPMTEAVLELEGDAGFAAELASADLGAEPPAEAVLSLVRGTAECALAHPTARLVYGQAIKASMALFELMKVLPEAHHAAAAARALQITLSLHAVYGAGVGDDPVEADARGEAGADAERDALAERIDEIRYRAACSGEENAITVSEACLRANSARAALADESGTSADAGRALLRMAADAALRFETTHAGRGG